MKSPTRAYDSPSSRLFLRQIKSTTLGNLEKNGEKSESIQKSNQHY